MKEKPNNMQQSINTGHKLDLITPYSIIECEKSLQALTNQRDLPIRITIQPSTNDITHFKIIYTNENYHKTWVKGKFTAQSNSVTLLESEISYLTYNLPALLCNIMGKFVCIAYDSYAQYFANSIHCYFITHDRSVSITILAEKRES